MKQNNYFRRILSALILLMASSLSWAYDFTVENEDGVTIYYNLINGGTEAEVTRGDNKYSGDIVIPSTVSYDGKTYRVTSIGGSAFGECNGLTSVNIPEGVKNIETYAFAYSTELSTVTIPKGMTTIGMNSFRGCLNLTTILIPEGVEIIRNDAFNGCSSLTSVTIGRDVTELGSRVFSGCPNLVSITVDENNPIFDSRDDCNAIIVRETNVLVIGCSNTTIPSSVTYIGSSAFDGCLNLTSITIPDNVKEIGSEAFSGCSDLTSVDIGNGVTLISHRAFQYCSNLSSIYIPSNVTWIGDAVFSWCSSLVSIKVSEDNEVFDSRDNCNAIIGYNTLLAGCNGTTIPNGIEAIGVAALQNLSSLTSVTIPDGVQRIGGYAFANCPNLTSISLPESVTLIDYEAFEGCHNLTSIVIPSKVESIGVAAFSGCSSLPSVTIPSSVTSIGGGAFSGCSALTSINIPEGVTSIEERVFSGCSSLTSVVIGNGVSSIGGGAFSDCSSLPSINIPESVIDIGSDAFSGCSSLTSITIPENVISIGNSVFSGCSGLTSVTIPKSVTSIGSGAFSGCSSLVSIIIPGSVTSIGRYAFSRCESLTSVTIPESVTSIGDWAFEWCNSLTTVICHAEDVPELGWDVFGAVPKHESILYVPASALEAYKEADQWKEFADIRPITGEEEVTLAIGDAHYATFIAPFDVEIPTNVEAYTVSGIKEDGKTLQLDELPGTIPANTPVVLYSNGIVNKTVTGWRTTQGTTYTHGLLTGVYTDRQAPADSYVLQSQDDEVAFYYVAWWNGYPTVTANHAYLTVPNANGIKAFRFGIDDETTGIQATAGGQESKSVIYDMTGRRVEKATKGMYIIDGKKVMVK